MVIPARDSERTIGRCVEGIRDQVDAAGGSVRVVVVDDGSVDETARVARDAGATVITAAGDGPARARNLGVREVETPIIIFTDADCAPRAGFVAALLAPFSDDAVAGTKGAYETAQRSLVARFVQVEYEERYARMARRPTIDFIDTYACAYRKSVFDEVGGFDERYKLPSTEDQELSFRVAALGRPMVFTPDARVGHLHVDTVLGYARKKAKIGRFKVATLRRHPGKAVTDSHTPFSLKLQLLLAPLVFVGLAGAAWGASVSVGAQALLGLIPAGLFLLTALPLWVRVLRTDFGPGVVAPLLILVRASALGVGVGLGLLGELRGGVLQNQEPT